MAVEKKGAGGGGGLADLESLMGGMDLENMDISALMKDLDPAQLQQLVMEGMNDPQVKEMVSCNCFYVDHVSCRHLTHLLNAIQLHIEQQIYHPPHTHNKRTTQQQYNNNSSLVCKEQWMSY